MAGPAPWRARWHRSAWDGPAGVCGHPAVHGDAALPSTERLSNPSCSAPEFASDRVAGVPRVGLYPRVGLDPELESAPSWRAPRVGERPELESAPSWRARRVELSMKQDRSAPRPRRTRASSLGIRAAPLRCGRRVRAEGQSRALARPSIAPAARAGRWARLAKRC